MQNKQPITINNQTIFGKLRSEGIVGTDEDPFAGWMRDPYDENWKKGALMNMSELEEFDPYFPGFRCRYAGSLSVF